MSEISEDLLVIKPKLIRNCRLSESPHQTDMLLMPEGVLQLKGTGAAIVTLCDGERNLGEILAELKIKFPTTDAALIESEVMSFLTTLRQKRVLDFL
jgi:pyrroloquinoline quinone biosynthesis protein D